MDDGIEVGGGSLTRLSGVCVERGSFDDFFFAAVHTKKAGLREKDVKKLPGHALRFLNNNLGENRALEGELS